ncbi:MAG: IclR family transcriptional regulator C-terminal domain-containing protein [Thalassobaculum sp.]|uniref:IclR family transcriptional regulator domain-containing protein n=1 Tax=Thalassobaculum sp. TaxID=2022740 RepID=UPI0032EC0F66
MIEPADKPPEFVEALAKGLAILQAFDAGHPEMTLSEVARRVGLSPAAARRSLLTLGCLGFVGQEGKRFHLRARIMALGSTFYLSARIEDLLLPELRAVVERFGDASSIGTLDGQDVIYVAHHTVQRARRAAAVVGARYPAYATSIGRVLLAALPDDLLERRLDALDAKPLTSRTCTDRAALHAELMRIRAAGFATTVDQLDYGITAIAVPVRDGNGQTVAALNSSGYTGIITPELLIEERLQELRVTASRIGQAMARYPILAAMLRS